jgi:hypothetical protein
LTPQKRREKDAKCRYIKESNAETLRIAEAIKVNERRFSPTHRVLLIA